MKVDLAPHERLQVHKAIAIAVEAFQDVPDGTLKLLHSLRVALRGLDAAEIAVGALHDVLEDTTFTAADLKMRGVDDSIIGVVQALTRDAPTLTYEAFVETIRSYGGVARRVKLHDLDDNLQRVFELESRERAEALHRRYMKARRLLLP